MRHGRRRRPAVSLRVRRELRSRILFFSPGAGGRDGGRGSRGTDELRKAVFYAVHVGEFAVVDDRHFPCGERYGRRLVCRLPTLDTEERIERVCYTFDLFDAGSLHSTKVEYGSVRRRDERSIGYGTGARSQRAIEESPQGRVRAEVGRLNLGKVTAEEEGIKLETNRSEPLWQFE